MENYYTVTVLFVLACFVLYQMWFKREAAGEVRLMEKQMKPNWFNIACLLAAALIVKALFAVNYEGYTTDMTCFKAWSDMIYDNGIIHNIPTIDNKIIYLIERLTTYRLPIDSTIKRIISYFRNILT